MENSIYILNSVPPLAQYGCLRFTFLATRLFAFTPYA